MIQEDYCSRELAKLLKEKGFDEPCQYFYRFDSDEIYRGTVFTNTQIGEKFYNAPTIQVAMKWLREVHDIDISIIPLRFHKEYLPRIESNTISHDAIPCRKHEEACEAAIKYCLINLVKTNAEG